MDFFETVKTRRSVRVYSDKGVQKEAIEQVIDAGRLAATARNEQPWEFIVTQDRDKLAEIGRLCPNGKFASGASCLIAVFSKDTKYYIEDSSAATQNMLLAIEALGLGGCWIAGDKKDYANEIRRLFVVPEGYKLVSMVSLGHPKTDEPPHPKRNLPDMIHWEKW
ncbi:MAG: nitroreductase family protein [Candidatus Omnitrophota bacterium]